MSSYEPTFKILTVPVTKSLPIDDLKTIVDDFKLKHITFGISKHKFKDNLYEIWREPFIDENKKNINYIGYKDIIETSPDVLGTRNFISIWEEGKLVYWRDKKCLNW